MKITIEISDSELQHVIGGANISYWAGRDQTWKRSTMALKLTDAYEQDFKPERAEWKWLRRGAFRKGLAVIAKEYPHHLQSILEENYDSVTGDVLIQCALFGEIKYS